MKSKFEQSARHEAELSWNSHTPFPQVIEGEEVGDFDGKTVGFGVTGASLGRGVGCFEG
jgi:hypothetical protein